MDNKEYIVKWLNDSLSEEELNIFKKSADYKALEKLDKSLAAYKAPGFDTEAQLNALANRRSKNAKIVNFKSIELFLRVAAVLVFALLGYIFVWHNPVTLVTTEFAEKKNISLPDQTEVRLNAETSLRYNKSSWDQDRVVTLHGEAYFKVSKGAQFDVNTDHGLVSVHGTQFNVKTRANYFEVYCYEGHVSVIYGTDSINLFANNGIRVLNDEFSQLESTDSQPAWISNVSEFSSVPFQEVLDEFERQYNVRIQTKNIDLMQLYSGSFSHSDLVTALKSITLPLNLNIERPKPNHIILSVD